MCIPKVILKNITLWGAYFRYTIIIKTEIADLLEHEVIVANINKLYWGNVCGRSGTIHVLTG